MSIGETIQQLVNNQDTSIESVLRRGSKSKSDVKALQKMLYRLGFGKELNWERFGADGGYGGSTVRAVKAFADKCGIDSNGEVVTTELATALIQMYRQQDEPASTPNNTVTPTAGGLTIKEVEEKGKTRVYVSDGSDDVRFTKFRKGVYYFGNQKTIDAINRNRESLQALGLTDSALNVMVAVSENEGNLDAINTWDNSFMTFGMFQWTVGAGKDPGELAALVSKIKVADPDLFEAYFGQFGLDVKLTSRIAGYFSINGQTLETPAEKELLRSNEWAYRFWKSGQNQLVQAIEIQHALSRINTFYKSNNYKPNGFYIYDLITSEYGMGLILDNHVNRPGYVKPCLVMAMSLADLGDPADWGTDEERELIKQYLKVRATFGKSPMTDAVKRADVTKKYLDKGIISDERDSFQFTAGLR
jgi:peptidoglycan hydrolase-like protein with peptidoglycan-binding domain